VSLAITEPDGGSDVAGIRTRAVVDGDDYVVSGAKLYITSGTRADFITTAVRTGGDGAGGISLLVIDSSAPGVTVSAPLAKMGWLCSDTAEITFDEVRVPRANLVGAEGSGFLQIVGQFAAERLSIAVQAYATAQRCLAQLRRQLGVERRPAPGQKVQLAPRASLADAFQRRPQGGADRLKGSADRLQQRGRGAAVVRSRRRWAGRRGGLDEGVHAAPPWRSVAAAGRIRRQTHNTALTAQSAPRGASVRDGTITRTCWVDMVLSLSWQRAETGPWRAD